MRKNAAAPFSAASARRENWIRRSCARRASGKLRAARSRASLCAILKRVQIKKPRNDPEPVLYVIRFVSSAFDRAENFRRGFHEINAALDIELERVPLKDGGV